MHQFRILIVDDHPIVRKGYQDLISTNPRWQVCGFAETHDEAIDAIEETSPHLAIIDISLREGNGLGLIKTLIAKRPNLKILVISAHDESLFAERALHAGAMGYINKQEATELLLKGISTTLNGEVFLSAKMTRRLLKRQIGGSAAQSDPIDTLTDRELDVLERIGQGHPTRKISADLQLSSKTIDRYRENIKRKLNLNNATELLQRATQWVLENR